jgi:hypothetical protein
MDAATHGLAVAPNPANAGVYDELFGHYVELYKRLNVG